MELDTSVERVDEYKFEPIKGYPMLNWKGKRPFKGTKYFPAQLKEVHGDDVNGWLNKIFWGDNIQVMSHLLKEYRGKVNLVYIDPPFDSKADYKKKIKLKGKKFSNDASLIEEKQYTDMWSNDEYLQFMYERLVLIRELLSDTGSVYLHCDWHKVHHLRCIMDEIFGDGGPEGKEAGFNNEVIWCYRGMAVTNNQYTRRHDNILFYSKTSSYTFNWKAIADPLTETTRKKYNHKDKDGRKFRLHGLNRKGSPIQNQSDISIDWLQTNPELCRVDYLDEKEGVRPKDWFEMDYINIASNERLDYPTQKPEALIERIIKASSNQNDIIFDCFMGSGTTMAVAQKLGRRFIGADINLGAIQTTTKRLLKIVDEYKDRELVEDEEYKACGFEVYNVNNYDVFRNPVQARDLLIEALEIDPLGQGNYFDGMKDGQKVKIMPVNRIATKKDVSDLINNLNYKEYEQLTKENSTAKVDDILLVCMGHDPEMKAHFKKECPYNINIDIYDILKDGSELVFKRASEAQIIIDDQTLRVKKFYPNTLLEKLRQDGTEIEDYREMVESIMIDTNYDGSVFEPTIVDIPEKNELVSGEYELPKDSGTIAIKITDLLSETYFEVVSNG